MTATESEKAARLEAARARVAAAEAFATALEPVPVKVGQWRVAGTRVFRVRREQEESAGYFWIGGFGGESGHSASAIAERSRLATPREVLDAKLATLTPEQRARVALGIGWRENPAVCVDGASVYFGSTRWWSRTSGKSDAVGYDNDIDNMLAALDAALATALDPKPLTRTEAIKARYVNEPRVTFAESEVWWRAIVDGTHVVGWDPSLDDASPEGCERVAEMVDAALAKPAPKAETAHCMCKQCAPLGEHWDRGPCTKINDEDLRAQLAAVTAERDALRRVIDLLHSDATAIRAAHAREVAAIDAMVARAKEAGRDIALVRVKP